MYDIASLTDISLLPAAEHFSDEVNEAIAYTKQWIVSFKKVLSDIKSFSFSRDVDKNIILHLKLHKIVKGKITPEEDRFMRKLVEMYALLHFDVIGDGTNPALHYWHKKLKSLLDKLEIETKKKIEEI